MPSMGAGSCKQVTTSSSESLSALSLDSDSLPDSLLLVSPVWIMPECASGLTVTGVAVVVVVVVSEVKLSGVNTWDSGQLLDGIESVLGFFGEVSIPKFGACACPSTAAGGGVDLFLFCTFSWMALLGGVCNTELFGGIMKLKPLPPVAILLQGGHTNVGQSTIMYWFGCAACDNMGNCCRADNGLFIPSGVKADGYTNGNWVPGVVGVNVG